MNEWICGLQLPKEPHRSYMHKIIKEYQDNLIIFKEFCIILNRYTKGNLIQEIGDNNKK